MTLLLALLMPWIARYGYAFIFAIVLAESAGLPLPGELALMLSAAYASAGGLSIVGIIAAAALGAIVGDTLGYWIGRRGGTRVLHLLGRLGGDAALERGKAFYARHGPKAVFFARFLPVLRVVGAVLAGVGEMDYRMFSLYNAAGGLAWAGIMGSLGYAFANHLPLLLRILHRVGIGVVVALITAAVLWWLRGHLVRIGELIRAVVRRINGGLREGSEL